MSNKKPENPPAFARSFSSYIEQTDGIMRVISEQKGMTLRDYFAGQAMKGLLSHFGDQGSLLGKICYEKADEMLEAREAK